MGETALDEDTFNEYLQEMKEHYTADKVSSLITGQTNWNAQICTVSSSR